MVNLLITELQKLKRSQMLLISFLGASAAPFFCFLALMSFKMRQSDEIVYFKDMFEQTNLYITLLIGVLLYGVITAYILNREYTDDTLKSILTIPVSRLHFMFSKFIFLFIWILSLTLYAWFLTALLGYIGQFEATSLSVAFEFLKTYLIGGLLLFLLSTPIIFITLIFKNFVPSIIFTIIITMINVLVVKSDYISIYPWSALMVITDKSMPSVYPIIYSYLSILITSLLGLIASILYFKNEDIQ